MLRSMYLSKKQRGVLDDLFSGKFSTQEVLEKWKVTRRLYGRWHEQPFFAAEYNRLINLTNRESELILACCTANVASRLVNLADSEKAETARKACMDIITHPDRKAKLEPKNPPPAKEPKSLPPEVASRLLTFLTDEKEFADED